MGSSTRDPSSVGGGDWKYVETEKVSKRPARRPHVDLVIQAWSKDGAVYSLINRVAYVHFLDAAFIPDIIKMSKYNPGLAVSELRRLSRYYIKNNKCYKGGRYASTQG